jgi:hypothetical protein
VPGPAKSVPQRSYTDAVTTTVVPCPSVADSGWTSTYLASGASARTGAADDAIARVETQAVRIAASMTRDHRPFETINSSNLWRSPGIDFPGRMRPD